MSAEEKIAEINRLQKRVRLLLWIFIVGLVASGVTAFPLVWEINLLCRWLGIDPNLPPSTYPDFLRHWIATVRLGVAETDRQFPFMAYGTDWLAFGHIVIALFFVGPLRDPVRNRFVLQAGLAACALVVPLALVCGPFRGIPFFWQIIDCAFGVIGSVPLLVCLRDVTKMEKLTGSPAPHHWGAGGLLSYEPAAPATSVKVKTPK